MEIMTARITPMRNTAHREVVLLGRISCVKMTPVVFWQRGAVMESMTARMEVMKEVALPITLM